MAADISAEALECVRNPWRLGADPEFAVFTPPRRITNAGEYRCEGMVPAGGIGQDHGGRVWELRPTAHQSAYRVLQNIWTLLRDPILKPVDRFKWKAGGVAGEDTMGGHVHFGFREWKPGQLQALAAVTEHLERLDILPSAEGPLRRDMAPDYGSLLGTRNSGGHVEYRAPASWLDRPGQALAVLATYKLAAFEPESTQWRRQFVKQDFLDWVAQMSQRDVDGFALWHFIDRHGFDRVQADPDGNFRPNWKTEHETLGLLLAAQ